MTMVRDCLTLLALCMTMLVAASCDPLLEAPQPAYNVTPTAWSATV